MLKKRGSNIFQWDIKAFDETIDFKLLEQGVYVLSLFDELDSRLSQLDYRILFLDRSDDFYHFSIIHKDSVEKVKELEVNNFRPYVLDM